MMRELDEANPRGLFIGEGRDIPARLREAARLLGYELDVRPAMPPIPEPIPPIPDPIPPPPAPPLELLLSPGTNTNVPKCQVTSPLDSRHHEMDKFSKLTKLLNT